VEIRSRNAFLEGKGLPISIPSHHSLKLKRLRKSMLVLGDSLLRQQHFSDRFWNKSPLDQRTYYLLTSLSDAASLLFALPAIDTGSPVLGLLLGVVDANLTAPWRECFTMSASSAPIEARR
jgi:hypothetical protein